MKLKSLLFNPFTRIAGSKALATGLVIMIASALIGAYSGTYFDGAIDIHPIPAFNVINALIFMMGGYIALVVVFYLFGVILAKGVRFVDIAGTVAFARWPYIIAALSGFLLGAPKDIQAILLAMRTPAGTIASILILVAAIWTVALLYKAYKVSTGLKGAKCTISFIVGLIVAEVLSKGIFIVLTILLN